MSDTRIERTIVLESEYHSIPLITDRLRASWADGSDLDWCLADGSAIAEYSWPPKLPSDAYEIDMAPFAVDEAETFVLDDGLGGKLLRDIHISYPKSHEPEIQRWDNQKFTYKGAFDGPIRLYVTVKPGRTGKGVVTEIRADVPSRYTSVDGLFL